MKRRIRVLFSGDFQDYRLQKAIEDPKCHFDGLKLYGILDTAVDDTKKAHVGYFYHKNNRHGKPSVNVSGDISFFIDNSWTQ